MSESWVVRELKPDHVLGLRLRACHERDMVRNDRSLSFDEHIERLTAINHRYTALIEGEIRRGGVLRCSH